MVHPAWHVCMLDLTFWTRARQFAALQDLRVRIPMIFMGVTAMRGFMQQRDIHPIATFISTAVERVQVVA